MEIGSSSTERVLQAALSGLAARQRSISDNVANVDTPGFKASRVEFEQALKSAMGREDGRPRVLMLTQVDNGLPLTGNDPTNVQAQAFISADTSRRMDGNNVDIDQEMVKLAETNLTYNALAQLTNGRLQLLRTIVNDGRRSRPETAGVSPVPGSDAQRIGNVAPGTGGTPAVPGGCP